MCALCKLLPKLHKSSEKHGGTIAAFDLIVDAKKYPELHTENTYYMILMANHSANILAATDIAQIHPATYRENKSLLIVLNPKYRENVNDE